MDSNLDHLDAELGAGKPVPPPVSAPVHHVFCSCPWCVEWVKRQLQEDKQP